MLVITMKIQLDTENKTITIEEDVNLHEFYEQINTILPGGLWREFTLKITKITEWKDPITLPSLPTTPWTEPYPGISPWTTSPPNTPIGNQPHIWYTTSPDSTTMAVSDSTTALNNGIYNLNVV